jgi:predicted amidohydrolase
MRGLNLALSICMELSFGEVVESWVDIVGGKVLCVADGAKLFFVINVSSWCLFLLALKNLLSH